MRTVLLHLTQNISIQEMFQLILMLNIFGFFKVSQYLMTDLHASHFRIFKVLKLGFFLSFCKRNILGFFFKALQYYV